MNKAIEFYKYIKENNIEWHWFDNNGVQDVIILPYTFQLEDFMELLSETDFDDEGVKCVLKSGYVAIRLGELFENKGIELSDVFPKDENDF
jgi:hypothetical protein